MTEHVRIMQDLGVLRLHLDKPEKRNALDDAMVAALIDAIDGAGRDDSVRAILLTAEGDHFCSGFDVVARNDTTAERKPRVGAIQRRLPSQAHRLVPLMTSVQVPIVASVRGWAVGIGLQLAAASDFAIATHDALLWEPFVERGFTPDSGATWLLPRLVGPARAREMLLLGRKVTGTEAEAWGLVHRAVAADELDATVDAVVRQLASGPTIALGLTKWLLHAGASAALDEQLRNEGFALELSSRSSDFREGLAALVQKRPPDFEGR
ncbi:MAG TPA: enoyl-CoA hydratase-related protein [Acidimicrobiales bacterium]|jgi:2-(1,2-epoxy-1,2-dihydrophenyl)acetyl-CoA isomerase|nr:enoyl-CoA hydratase-related protein [Acidimicrobiales bacterium]